MKEIKRAIGLFGPNLSEKELEGVVVLEEWKGLRYKETGAAINIQLGNNKSRIFKAKVPIRGAIYTNIFLYSTTEKRVFFVFDTDEVEQIC